MLTTELSKKILIIEDDPDNQELLKEVIGHYIPGCTYATVNDGNEAVKIAESLNFDLVFMDMSLPNKNGFEITNILRKTKDYKEVPIVALTGQVMKGMKEKALNSGFDEYLAKPCTPKDIMSVIKKYINNKAKILIK